MPLHFIFYSIAYYILLGRDHWVLGICSLTLKKREKVPSAWSQNFTKKRTCSFWGKIFGWLLKGYTSSAGKYNTDVTTLFKFLFVHNRIPRDLKYPICCSRTTRQVVLHFCVLLNPVWFLGISDSYLGTYILTSKVWRKFLFFCISCLLEYLSKSN